MTSKAKPAFLSFLAVISILGFFSIAVSAFSNFNINEYVLSIIFILIGVGLLIEGNVRVLPKMLKNGLTGDEISHIFAIVIGIVAIISGFLSFPFIGIASPVFEAVKGILSAGAIIIIIIEAWFVK